MTEMNPNAPADPLAQQAPPSAADAPSPTDTPAPTAAEADVDMAQVLALLHQQQDTIAQLQRDLSARPPVANPSVTVASTAPAGGPTPAAFDHGVPAHAMHSGDSADLTEGDVIRFNVAASNGGDPLTGYGLVIDVVDNVKTLDANGNDTGDTHTEYVVARLDVVGTRLRAENIVDDQTSARVQAQLDAANG